MTKLIIADDHTLFREGVVELLTTFDFIEVVNAFKNGQEVIDYLNLKNEVELILLDISMPILNGIETSKMIVENYPLVKILMLTMHDTSDYIRQLLEIGVHGYLLKSTSKDELKMALKKVVDGENFYSREIQASMIESCEAIDRKEAVKLSSRETEILEEICNELSTKEIAEKLFISTHTVETHRKNLLNKTGAKNVVGLVRYAILNKLFLS